MRRLLPALLLLVVSASSALAQVTVGVYQTNLNASDPNLGPVRTNISLDNPATGSGQITTVAVGWSTSGCTNAIKIKFFRRSGNTLTMTAERGPFNGAGSPTILTMSPAVPVQTGDLIGVAQVADCGNAVSDFFSTSSGFLTFANAVTGSVEFSPAANSKRPLALIGSSSSEVLALGSVLPVVGSVAGSFGASFKTSVQLLNPASGGAPLTGRLVFHRASAVGSPADPSLAYTLTPGVVVAYADVVTTMGQSGLGSIDVMAPPGVPAPIILTRIYNDAGAAGTAGFFEDAVPLNAGAGARVISAGNTGFLITPIDPARTRFNIGVRTFSGGATMIVVLERSDGTAVTSVGKTYPANWFEQVDAGTFFFGAAIGANLKVRINVSSGSAIIYGSTTDNVTNDPSVQFATSMPTS
ncbi:MAG TPA: hypothetical protein VER58_02975 [Thermoanaerobaculia bacterium]|nr:hypothetical protein [Thermoanaerobaculia bacterium]